MSYYPLTQQEKKYQYGTFSTFRVYPIQFKTLQAVADSLCELAEIDYESITVPTASLTILGGHLMSLLEQIRARRLGDGRQRGHAGAEHDDRIDGLVPQQRQRLASGRCAEAVDGMELAVGIEGACALADREPSALPVSDAGLGQPVGIGRDEADAAGAQRANRVAHRARGCDERIATSGLCSA